MNFFNHPVIVATLEKVNSRLWELEGIVAISVDYKTRSLAEFLVALSALHSNKSIFRTEEECVRLEKFFQLNGIRNNVFLLMILDFLKYGKEVPETLIAEISKGVV